MRALQQPRPVGACFGAALLAPVIASGQTTLWLHQVGTSDADAATALLSDGDGTFVAGDTGASLGLPSAGAEDVWIARYDAAGARTWLSQFGSSGSDHATALAPDDASGFFIAGHTTGALGGAPLGASDAWLGRYDGAGKRLWARILGSDLSDYALALAPDDAGGAFMAGFTNGEMSPPTAGGRDAWLARYSAGGALRWLTQFGTDGLDSAAALAPVSGGVFVAGTTDGDLAGSVAGSADAWLARYDSFGQRRWIVQTGSVAEEAVRAAAPDGGGGVFLAGTTGGSFGAAHAGSTDIWLARYDGAGGRLWLTQFGTEATDDISAIAPARDGGVYLAGSSAGALAGPSAGAVDAWIAHCDAQGRRTWSTQLGTPQRDVALAVALGAGGELFAAGATDGVLGPGYRGSGDAWVGRFADVPCPADCDGSGALDVADFLCFQNLFAAADPAADCDGDTELTFFDFLCFQNAFAAGCP
ncbi:MAG: GC-type dockerin domain-anchored protein [Phycisphaerales bacterium JB039]